MQRGLKRSLRYAGLVVAVAGALGMSVALRGDTPATHAQAPSGLGAAVQVGTMSFNLGVTTTVSVDVNNVGKSLNGQFTGSISVLPGNPGAAILEGDISATDSQGNQMTMKMKGQTNGLALSMQIDPTGLSQFTPDNDQLLFAQGMLSAPLLSGAVTSGIPTVNGGVGITGGGIGGNGLGDLVHWVITDGSIKGQ